MFIKKIPLYLCMVLLPACSETFNSEQAIVPQINVPITQIGHNKKIFVVVEDARPDNVIGRDGSGNNITIEQNVLLKNIKDKIDNGLLNNKFQLIDNDKKTSTTLTVRILGVQYRQMTLADQYSMNHALATVALEAIATSNGKTLKKSYRTDNDNYYIIPMFINDMQKINYTIETTVEKLLIDKTLVEFMAN